MSNLEFLNLPLKTDGSKKLLGMMLGVWVWRAELELLDYQISDRKKNSMQKVLQSCWGELAIRNSSTENKANKKVRLYHSLENLENVIIVHLHSYNKNFKTLWSNKIEEER